MVNIISLIILLISFIGIVVIILRKVPALAELSSQETINKKRFLSSVKEKIKSNSFVNKFSKEALLQKGLSKIRVLSMKAENKTADWLRELRQKSIEKKKSFQDDYWKKLRRKK